MLLHEWIASKLNPVIMREEFVEVSRFNYLVNCFFVNYSEVILKVMDPSVQSFEEVFHLKSLKCLRRVLRMPTERLPHCELFSEVAMVEVWVEVFNQWHDKMVRKSYPVDWFAWVLLR